MSETSKALQVGTGKTLHDFASADGTRCGAEWRNGRRAYVRLVTGVPNCARCARCTSNVGN